MNKMGYNAVSAGSRAKRSAQSDAKVPRTQQCRVTSLAELRICASRCHTPKQFRELLDNLRTLLPFQHLLCVWGYPSRETIGFIFNHSFPVEFLRWYLTEGMLWRGPVFRAWLKTNKTQIGPDVRGPLKDQFDPELLERARRANMKGLLFGGVQNQDFWMFFAMTMGSDENCQMYSERFEAAVPILAQAFQRACPRPLLTKRETAILKRRTMGERIKQIAAAAMISDRTVREHLQSIKKKLYTDDLVNAVVIAVRSGMLLRTW